MFLKNICIVALGALLMTADGTLAAEYRPDDFLTLDLPKAVLSPTPLGPRNRFVPWPFKTNSDSVGDSKAEASHASQVHVIPERVARTHDRPPHTFAQKPPGAARTRLAQRHGNPLDARAQAPDRRVQTWPCRSGGICNWKQVPSEASGD
jgi:hypothetical protein